MQTKASDMTVFAYTATMATKTQYLYLYDLRTIHLIPIVIQAQRDIVPVVFNRGYAACYQHSLPQTWCTQIGMYFSQHQRQCYWCQWSRIDGWLPWLPIVHNHTANQLTDEEEAGETGSISRIVFSAMSVVTSIHGRKQICQVVRCLTWTDQEIALQVILVIWAIAFLSSFQLPGFA